MNRPNIKQRQFFTLLIVLSLPVSPWYSSSMAVAAELPESSAAKHMGVATCAASQCHGSAIPRDGTGVLQNEYVTWTQSDPHSKAYTVLSEERSRLIAARLGIGRAREATICLDCHADNVPLAKRGIKFQISDGVGCEACHGGAENWLATHYNAPEVTHADNISAGLYPNEDADDRADLCLSCHLGTRNKFATHRIMAAGHPRLAIELDTFTELWRTAGRQPHYLVDADYRERKNFDGHSYTWAAGLLAEGRSRLDLIQSDRFNIAGMFPELAFYDCHACHRSMRSVQWRSLPRHGGVGPGVPFINDGTFVMALALARAIEPGEAEDLQRALSRLHVAGSRSVSAIRSAALDLDGVLARIESRLTPAKLRNRERQILEEILETGAEGNYLDYLSAEQAFMAVQMFVIELDDAELEVELDDLANTLNNDERYRPAQFRRLLASLREDST
ncbi:MAG: multiheme c-type cytochrome [Woeseiaceae bacterium]